MASTITLAYLSAAVAVLTIDPTWSSVLDGRKLVGAGIVIREQKQVRVYSTSQTGTIVLRLLPYISSDHESCIRSTIEAYNTTVTNILSPLGEAIQRIQGSYQESALDREGRLVGAIVGGVALGVATAAQITAASALIQANENAKNILRLKDSIAKTNEAVRDVAEGVGHLAIAVGKLQDFVNEEFNKTTTAINCVQAAQRLGVELSLYLTEITTVFGPQITSPALTQLTIQAVYNLAGGNLDVLLNRLGADNSQLSSLVGSGLISGQPILYDAETQILGIQITLPSIGNLKGVLATYLDSVAVDTPAGLASPLIPRTVIQSNGVVEELDTSPCVEASADIYCTKITTLPIAQGTTNCLLGNVSQCLYSKTNGVLTTPYMTLNGKIVANCRHVTCRCHEPSRILSQDYGEAVLLIDSTMCQVLNLDGVSIKLDGRFDSEYSKNISIGANRVIVSSTIDITTELGSVNQTLQDALDKLDQSDAQLNKVNVRLASTEAMVTYIVLTVLAIVLGLVGLGLGCYSMMKVRAQAKTILWLGAHADRAYGASLPQSRL
ncbi:fusion protein [Avian paramyxovirus 17]|uniref:Fusion glycoprotein F0 n=1 Tax=Avian paramyxovirus 17 TaxID=2094282 RepID=A0A2L2FLB5_9MONO|nr:fusion protein [Avian paramyxovirus 17]AVG72387.1 fusion protein [Avian paramyxovirus 17]